MEVVQSTRLDGPKVVESMHFDVLSYFYTVFCGRSVAAIRCSFLSPDTFELHDDAERGTP